MEGHCEGAIQNSIDGRQQQGDKRRWVRLGVT